MSAFNDKSGKISSKLFNEIVQPQTGRQRTSVIIGPKFGVDVSVIDMGDGMGLAVSSDPLSLIPSLGLEASAWLSVHLLANDMATTGFAPKYVQFVLNLPPEFSLKSFKKYWEHIHTFCDEMGVAITGGHTAQAPGQGSTTPGGGTMFLQAPLERIITGDGAEPGDRILVTKESALTASSILAKSFPEIVNEKCGEEVYRQACDNFYRTSSLQDALVATDVLQPKTELKAMHDVTEGGILGGISEMAEASGCGFRVNSDRLPTGKASKRICELFGIDHRLSVGAGSMIMAVKKGKEDALIMHLQDHQIPVTEVGEMIPKEEGTVLVEDDEEKAFTFNGEDPYWNAFYKAMEAGWK